ncbi:MAG TPA: hypothetical protein PLT69_13440, partial [Deltaproteobacteria bacterium]|nr:hypothetical protein [Deltaproteobacteria bacterium]
SASLVRGKNSWRKALDRLLTGIRAGVSLLVALSSKSRSCTGEGDIDGGSSGVSAVMASESLAGEGTRRPLIFIAHSFYGGISAVRLTMITTKGE